MRKQKNIEIYPMRKNPNRWAWRLLVGEKIICKCKGTFKSKCQAELNFYNVSDIIKRCPLSIIYKENHSSASIRRRVKIK